MISKQQKTHDDGDDLDNYDDNDHDHDLDNYDDDNDDDLDNYDDNDDHDHCTTLPPQTQAEKSPRWKRRASHLWFPVGKDISLLRCRVSQPKKPQDHFCVTVSTLWQNPKWGNQKWKLPIFDFLFDIKRLAFENNPNSESFWDIFWDFFVRPNYFANDPETIWYQTQNPREKSFYERQDIHICEIFQWTWIAFSGLL